MPVQSQTIVCPSNQWTSIAEYMDRRATLIVQCPQQAVTVQQTNVVTVGGVPTVFAAANPLRTRLILTGSTINTIWYSLDAATLPGATNFAGIPLTTGNPGTGLNKIGQYEITGPMAGEGWWYETATIQDVVKIEETVTCAAIVLGIKTLPASVAGPYGSVPPGIWQTPDLLSGPSEFRINRAADADLVIQEWFAWPVGSGDVTVQIFQAFDDLPPQLDADYGTFQVGLPSLSPAGKMYLDNLRRKISGIDRGIHDEL
jgi:hypothetical protein